MQSFHRQRILCKEYIYPNTLSLSYAINAHAINTHAINAHAKDIYAIWSLRKKYLCNKCLRNLFYAKSIYGTNLAPPAISMPVLHLLDLARILQGGLGPFTFFVPLYKYTPRERLCKKFFKNYIPNNLLYPMCPKPKHPITHPAKFFKNHL